MANVSNINGFLPVMKIGGGVVSTIGPYKVTDSTEINVGDVVELVDKGTSTSLDVATAGHVVGIIGIAAGYASSAKTDQEIMVWPALADVVYECQQGASGGTGLLAAGGIGKCADHVVVAGSQETGPNGTKGASKSGHYLSDTVAATGLFHILQLSPKPNNAYGSNAKVWVTFNEGALVGAANGIADV